MSIYDIHIEYIFSFVCPKDDWSEIPCMHFLSIPYMFLRILYGARRITDFCSNNVQNLKKKSFICKKKKEFNNSCPLHIKHAVVISCFGLF